MPELIHKAAVTAIASAQAGWDCQMPSPDGQEIAFTSNREDGSEIYVMHVASRALRRMTHNTMNELNLVWLP